jgi:ATPase subunit of ABC transporter with duplicated ATPase domains
MLQVSNISKSYGLDTILSDVSFIINAGERVALVGSNGCGKTTLLHIITGSEVADSGGIRFTPPELAAGYLAQALTFEAGDTVDQALARLTANHSQAWQDMQRLAGQMGSASAEELTALTQAYAAAELRFEAAGGYALEPRLAAVLSGLGLANVPRDLPVDKLSGGQKTRLGLAALLINQPRLLLLDEPTNHLDIDALAWLENWLRHYHGAVLIVSHDRAFLDRTVSRILELDKLTHRLTEYVGNYSDYAAAKKQQLEKQWSTWQQQQTETQRLQTDIQRTKQQAQNTEQSTTNDHTRRLAKKVAKKAKAREQRLQRFLDSEERVEKPERQWQLKVDFAADSSGARQVLALENVGMAFSDKQLFRDITLTLRHGQRVALIGPNGQGKTTLLRIITGQLTPTAGQVRLGAGVSMGYLAQEQEALDPGSTPFDAIRAVAENMSQTDIRSFLHRFLFAGDEVFVKVEALSFGERARLMLALLVAQGCNFLLLDEPINHLDIASRELFEQALDQFPGTMLAVVHDRAFIRRMATEIWELRDGQLQRHFGLPE